MAINWVPFSPKAMDFLKNSTARYNISYGSVRSSKTVTMTVRWLEYMLTGPQGDLIMMGYSQATLQRNVLNDFFDIVGPGNYKWINRQQGELEILGRRVYALGASNEKAESRIRGATFAGAYCDEANLFPKTVWMQLQARLSVPGAMCFANCNPESPKHWFYTDVIVNPSIKDKKIWKFTMKDNNALTPEYIESLSGAYSGVFKKRFIDGEWCVAEGAIYQEYASNLQDFQISEDSLKYKSLKYNLQTVNIGIDYGASKSKIVFSCSGITKNWDLVALDEYVSTDLLAPDQIYLRFEKFYLSCQVLYGKIYKVYCDYGALGQILTKGLQRFCMSKGYPVQIEDCKKGKILDRILLTLRLMGERRFFLSSKCKCLDAALMTAVWDEDHEDTRLDDGTSDIDSLDAFEYSFYSYSRYLNSSMIGMKGFTGGSDEYTRTNYSVI